MDKEESSIHMEMPSALLTLTPGNVTDYSHLRRTISGYYVQDGASGMTAAASHQYQVASISFDRWNSSTLVTQLTGDGVLMAPIGMGYASQSAHCESWSATSWRSS